MKPESLEALLIDRSLGELTPEAAELLEERLARDPVAAQRARELETTLLWARKATAITLEAPARPLAPGRAAPPAFGLAWFRAGWADGLRLAACVVLGLAAGWWAHAERSAPTVASFPVPTQQREVRPGVGKEQGPTFWSMAYLREQQRDRPRAGRDRQDVYQIPWESIVK